MGKRRLRWLLAGSAVAVMAVTAALAATAYGGSKAGNNKIIIDGTTGTVVNIDPANEYDYDSFTVDLPIYQGLYGFPTGAKLKPVLATGCGHTKNLKTWTCHLRHGVKFSNGDSMTSADVKYSFDRVQAIKGDQGIYTLLSYLKSTTTNGPYTVIFHLTKPFSVWPYILSTNAGYVVDKNTYPANKILANTDTAHMVGTGPYALTKFTPGQQAVLTPNKHYWGPKPKNGGIIIDYYSKSSTMKLDLQQGHIDMAFRTFTPTEISSLRKTKNVKVHAAGGVDIRYLVFNVKRPPFNNINVRRAIAYLMPRQVIAKRVWHGTVRPLYSMVPAGLPGHTNAYKTLYGAKPNLAKAKAAMKKAHVKKPLPITLWYTPTHYGDVSADEYIEMQRALNASKLFKVSLKSAEWAQYSPEPGKRYGAFQLGWFPDYPDADDYTVSFYQPNAFYANDYNNKTMNKLIARERANTGKKRIRALKAMQLLAAKTLPTIPYWQGTMIAVGRSNVSGIPSTLDAAYYILFWLPTTPKPTRPEGRPERGASPSLTSEAPVTGTSLRSYLLTRLALVVPMVLILLTLVFLLMRVAPGNPIEASLGGHVPHSAIKQIEHRLGFDKPLYQQYGEYLYNIVRGNFGTTITDNRPLTQIISQNGAATLELTFFAMLIAIVVGVLVGLVAGRFRDTSADVFGRLFGIVIYAMPVFFLGLMAQLVFGVWLGWLPISDQASPLTQALLKTHTNILFIDAIWDRNWAALADVTKHLILPALTLGLVTAGVFIRLVRINVIRTLRDDYIEAARARGITERRVVYSHAFKNALVPVITIIGLNLAVLLGGAVLTEETFNWPGLGHELVLYVQNRDYIGVQGIIVVFALVVVAVSVLVDFVNAYVDPRIRY